MTDDHFEKLCFCSLNRIFGYEPALARKLIDELGSASALFNMRDEEIRAILGPFSKYRDAFTEDQLGKSEREIQQLENEGKVFISINDACYPPMLKECNDAPVGLYIKSSSEPECIFTSDPFIAVVGTRDLSLYGKEWCSRIISAMATTKSRPVVVSGLAIGTDINAHASAMENGLKTIAVMATGIDDVYPARHREFARIISESPGCALITDYPTRTSPVAINFIRRNRIIAGLCQATVVIESKEKGGAMITANLANSYNRDVYALPGRIDDLRSQGCNRLIRAKVAEPVSDLESFIDSIGLGVYQRRASKDLGTEIKGKYEKEFDGGTVEKLIALAGLVKKCRGITVEELCSRTNLHYSEVASLTGILEKDMIIDIDLFQRCSINVKKA